MRPFITPNGAILINRLSDNKGLQTAQHLAIGHIGGIIAESSRLRVRGPRSASWRQEHRTTGELIANQTVGS